MEAQNKQSGVVNHGAIKNYNRKKILNLISARRELTKQVIALRTGISIPTVANNVSELIQEGLVEEAGVADSTGGRKPLLVRYLPNARYAFGVDFASDKVRVILTNLDSEILYETGLSLPSNAGMDPIITKIAGIIENVLAEKEIPQEKVLGVGFSLPGTVNEKQMVLELAPNLGMKDIHFKSFSSILKYPYYIENEANAAALAELALGSQNKMNNLAYVSIKEGIGVGLIINGTLYKGKNQRAGEFGHMTIMPDGLKCNCGRNGCWELYASEKSLAQKYQEEFKGGQKTPLYILKDFISLVREKDRKALKIWNEYLDYLAVGLRNLILGLDPQAVILGGEISKYSDQLLEPLRERIFTKNSFDDKEDVKLVCSKIGLDASILGASLIPIQKLFV